MFFFIQILIESDFSITARLAWISEALKINFNSLHFRILTVLMNEYEFSLWIQELLLYQLLSYYAIVDICVNLYCLLFYRVENAWALSLSLFVVFGSNAC